MSIGEIASLDVWPAERALALTFVTSCASWFKLFFSANSAAFAFNVWHDRSVTV